MSKKCLIEGNAMNLSICIITKNEKEKLFKCLSAIDKLDCEIVVVDTGSTDGTKEMAAGFTDKIFDFEWCDDFSAARNFAAENASNDWILMIDSDEYITGFDVDKIARIMINKPDVLGRVKRENVINDNGEERIVAEYISRLYRKSRFCYEGRIHEQVVDIDRTHKYDTMELPITLLHDGYSGDVHDKAKKAERNIRLLLLDLQERPDDTYVLYQLGKSYYMAGNYESALQYFEDALQYDVNPKLEYVIDMVETYGYTLLKLKMYDVALQLYGVYDEFGDCADFKILMGLIFMNNMMFDKAVEEFLAATRYSSARTVGANSFIAYYNAGVIKECLGAKDEAKKYYLKCGDYGKAKERLKAFTKKNS